MDEAGGDRHPRAEGYYATAHSATDSSPFREDRVGVWRCLERYLSFQGEGCDTCLATIDAAGVAANRSGAATAFSDGQLNSFVRGTTDQPPAADTQYDGAQASGQREKTSATGE